MVRSRRFGVYAGLVAGVCLVPALASAQVRPGTFAQRGTELRAKARAKGEVRIIANVAGAGADAEMLRGRADLASRARGRGAKGVKAIGQLPLVAMTVDEATLNDLLTSGQITDVMEDWIGAPTLASTIPVIGADMAQAAGVTGERFNGVGVIAIVDTGVDIHHPDLEVINGACFSTTVGVYTNACPGGVDSGGTASADACVGAAAGVSGCDHGTHVAGIAAGTNGVAPDAQVVALNVFSVATDVAGVDTPCAANSTPSPCMLYFGSDLIAGLETVQVFRSNFYELSSVNMSLGGPLSTANNCDDGSTLNTLINNLSATMGVVASSGNASSTNSVGTPGCFSNAIAVGNTTDADVVAATSNAGPALDLWAPGSDVTSTIPVVSPMNPNPVGSKSGTSMSSPHVAGAFALLRQLNPALTVAEVRTVLTNSGVTVTDTRAGGTISRPRIDLFRAVRETAQTLVTPQSNDLLGRAMAIGDFNNDGFDDLVLGLDQVVHNSDPAGAVDVFYGSDVGPGIVRFWTQDTIGNTEGSQLNDGFGRAVAVGDFNQDGFDDLAIGAPTEDVGTVVDAGSVHVIYGSAIGLTKSGSNFFSQDAASVNDSCETNDQFGYALTAGDFNNDGKDDLAIGVRREDVGAIVDAGAVNVIYGSPSGLSATVAVADQLWTQDVTSILEGSQTSDFFGQTLAAGDFNNDGYSDLVVGAPGEERGGFAAAGGVNVIYGSTAGLHATTVANQFWAQDRDTVQDDPEASDKFGDALAVGDFNNDGLDDLAISAPYESVGAVAGAGATHVLFGGGPAGLHATLNQLWTQDWGQVEDSVEADDNFGASLAAGDVNNDGYADLIITATGENTSGGVVHVIHGSFFGPSETTVADQLWSQNSAGILDSTENGDRFGYRVGVGDFNGDGRADLAVGVPNESVGAVTNAGLCNVLFQASSGGLSSTGNVALTE